jgi:hypothetical protein
MKNIILALTVILMGGATLSTANAAPAPASVIQAVAEVQDASASLQQVGGYKRHYKRHYYNHYYKHNYYKPHYYKGHYNWYPPYKGFCYDYPYHWWCKKYYNKHY